MDDGHENFVRTRRSLSHARLTERSSHSQTFIEDSSIRSGSSERLLRQSYKELGTFDGKSMESFNNTLPVLTRTYSETDVCSLVAK